MLTLALFYTAAFVAVVSTLAVIFSRNPVYSVLYLIASLFAVAGVFYTLGAPFLAMTEIIIYAGAIMVLFLFVVMMLNLGQGTEKDDLATPSGKSLLFPVVMSAFIIGVVIFALTKVFAAPPPVVQDVKSLALALYGKNFLGVKLAAFILLIGSIGGMHLGRAASTPDTKETQL